MKTAIKVIVGVLVVGFLVVLFVEDLPFLGESKKKVSHKFDPDDVSEIRFMRNKTLAGIYLKDDACNGYDKGRFKCDRAEVEKWLDQLEDLGYSENRKANSSLPKIYDEAFFKTPEGEYSFQIRKVDDQMVHVIHSFRELKPGSRAIQKKAGYLAANENLFFPDLKRFRTKGIPIPKDVSKVEYRFKGKTFELNSDDRDTMLDLLESMKLEDFAYSGKVTPQVLKEHRVDLMINNFPGGHLKVLGDNGEIVLHLGRPHETDPKAHAWVEGDTEIMALEFKRWGEFEKLVKKIKG